MQVSIGVYAVILVFFFLVMPGFIARRFYCNGEFSKQVNWKTNSISNLFSSLFVGILLSMLFVILYNSINKTSIDLDSLLNEFDNSFVSTTETENSQKAKKFTGFTNSLYQKYIPFIGGLYFFCALIGFYTSKLIIFLSLDTKYKIFRYSNNWHYLFSGKILKFKKNSLNSYRNLKVKHTYLDILVSEKGDETTLYSGFYADYEVDLNDVNKLDKIHLYKAIRYKKCDDGTVIKRDIPGDIFSLMGEKILNINSIFICYDESEIKNRKFVLHKRILIPVQFFSVITFFLVLISLVFSLNIFKTPWYQTLLTKSIYVKALAIFSLNFSLGLITPFTILNEEKKVKFSGWNYFWGNLVLAIVLSYLAFYFYQKK